MARPAGVEEYIVFRERLRTEEIMRGTPSNLIVGVLVAALTIVASGVDANTFDLQASSSQKMYA